MHDAPSLALVADASYFEVGSVVQQQRMNKAQTRYRAYDRELLAIYESAKHFRRA